MNRLIGVVLFSQLAICTLAQTVSQPVPTSDPQALSLAQKSIAALTGGTPITDVTISANVTSILGSDNETGTGTIRAKGNTESRVDLSLTTGIRSEVRDTANGVPAGAWSTNGNASTAMAQHNAWIDAAWFFPPLSSLSQTANPQFVFVYVGQEQHDGLPVQHIRSYQVPVSAVTNSLITSLSAMDFYLDPNSYLPLAIGFNQHADKNIGVTVPVEIRFANYQAVNGIQVPFHFQQLLNGSLILDATVTSAAFNTGLLDSTFTLQ
jgi:hypothetical protein